MTLSDKLKPHTWLFLVLLVAAALRLWGIDFALPNLARPDEQNIATTAVMQIIGSFARGEPSLNPQFFYYPTLYIYLVTLIYTLYYLLGHLTGFFPDLNSFAKLFLDDWSHFLLISRLITVAFALLNIWAMTRLAACVTRSRTWGLLAGLLLAVTYLHVRDSHFGVTDIAATAWVTLCLWQALSAYIDKDSKALSRAAILAGLAASTKYPATLVMLAPLTAFYSWHRNKGRTTADFVQATPLVKTGLRLLGLYLGAFLLTSPFVLLDFSNFWEQFSTQQHSFSQLFMYQKGLERGWIRHFTFGLWYGLGGLYLISALTGMGLAWRTDRRLHTIPLLFAAVYYLAIGNTYSSFVRYILPLTPVFCLYAILCLQWLNERLQPRLSPALAPILMTGLWLLVAGQSLFFSLRFDQLIATEDTRTQARNWLMAHLQPDEGVGIGKALSHVDLPMTYRKYFLSVPERYGNIPFGSPQQFQPTKQAQVSPTETPRREWNITTYADISALQTHRIRYVVVAKSPLSFYETPTQEADRIARQPGLKLVQRFSPVGTQGQLPPESAYDYIDAFYIPYSDFADLKRPGPELLIYAVETTPSPVARSAKGSDQKSE